MKHDELVPVILEMIEKGYSRGEIARELGMTRNAVIGLAWRRKLPQATPEARIKSKQPVFKHSNSTIAAVLRLHREGLTAPAIGQKVGLNEGQVYGLIYRYKGKGITMLETPPPLPVSTRSIDQPILVAQTEPPEGVLTVFNISPSQCRFICDDGYFCGAEKRAGSAYCAEHHDICYVPPKRKAKNDPAVRAVHHSAVSIRSSARHAVHI